MKVVCVPVSCDQEEELAEEATVAARTRKSMGTVLMKAMAATVLDFF